MAAYMAVCSGPVLMCLSKCVLGCGETSQCPAQQSKTCSGQEDSWQEEGMKSWRLNISFFAWLYFVWWHLSLTGISLLFYRVQNTKVQLAVTGIWCTTFLFSTKYTKMRHYIGFMAVFSWCGIIIFSIIV